MIATQASFPPEQRTILVGALELTDRHLREVLIPAATWSRSRPTSRSPRPSAS